MTESFRTLSRVELEEVITDLEQQVDDARFQKKVLNIGRSAIGTCEGDGSSG